jgi:hypothetical protein
MMDRKVIADISGIIAFLDLSNEKKRSKVPTILKSKVKLFDKL